MDADEQIIELSPAPWLVKTAIGALAFGGGLALGYFLGRHRRKGGSHDDPSKQYWDLTADQLQDRADIARDLEQMRAKDKEPPTHEKVIIEEEAYYHLHTVPDVDEGRVVAVVDGGTGEEVPVDQYLAEKASRNGSEGFNQDEPSVEEFVREEISERLNHRLWTEAPFPGDAEDVPVIGVDRNIFAADPASQGWNYEEELAARSPDRPYVLHTDEFVENAMEFNQIDLTWFEGDRTMVEDLAQQAVHNWRTFLIDPLPFGWGSGDPEIVYIQNEERKTAYSISKDDRSWAEMQGYEPDMDEVTFRHSSPVRKFRPEG